MNLLVLRRKGIINLFCVYYSELKFMLPFIAVEPYLNFIGEGSVRKHGDIYV